MPKRTELNQELKARYGFNPSTLETIDTAFFNYLNDDLNIFCDTNDGFHKVPVLFASPERAFQIKDNPTLRPNGRTLEYPLMSIVRGSVINNPSNKGKYGVYIPPYFGFYKKGGAIPFARRVNQEKSRERANLTAKKIFKQDNFPFDNEKVVYDTLYIPMPTYVEVTYEVKIIAEYQSQMNQIIQAFLGSFSTPVAFKIEHDGHVFEAFGDETFATIVFDTTSLKRIISNLDSKRSVSGGDNNAARMYLLNLQKLFSSDVIKAFKETKDAA